MLSMFHRQDKALAAGNNLPVSNIQMLSFKISSEVSDIIEDAKENIDLLVQDVEISSFTFDAFGKEDIKTLKLSPDSFIQIAIQMAYIKYQQYKLNVIINLLTNTSWMQNVRFSHCPL